MRPAPRSGSPNSNEVYANYGYCHNYLTEIRLLGAKGMEQILYIMNHLRETQITHIGDFSVKEKIDRSKGAPQPHLSRTDTSARNILIYYLENITQTTNLRVTVRPSGTEPKIASIVGIREKLERSFMQYCYQLLEVDFPERGFLLFWQLPLDSKLKYFEIEEQLAGLKGVSDANSRKAELDKLLSFLGANPVEKVNNAFREKYKTGIMAYLELE
jgi:phosphoglucomutase/phosphomannomutase